ncbi:PTS ascorbate transporter subunit IIC [Streptomonospora alba]|uniref:PTS ascorbate transporter subunit IIC n=1 Tax=Streptomonospora alba TaxID=183763 RepID=UPI00069C0FA4|nr:PTS ascorbate transporter subunit IIC [Streptomonospora alba]
MDWLVAVAQFIVNEILSVPAYMVGLITAVGLIALRRSTGQIIGGGLKAVLGFLLIGAGADIVVAALDPLGQMIQGAAGAQGVVPTNEAIVAIAQERFGAQVAWIMIAGFALSLVLARVTTLHYVFLTGHHILFMATLLTMVLATTALPTWLAVALGALLLAVVMVSLPALAQPWTRRVGGDGKIAIGHFGTLGYVASGATGQLVGRTSRSTEDLKLPEGLRFLRDSMVATALSMVLIYVVVALVFWARQGTAAALDMFPPAEGLDPTIGHFLMQSLMQGLQFGIGVAVILYGVRTILGELVPAFQGIADRVVPGAVPALDAPIVFPYAQNAVLVGFLSSFVGGLATLAVMASVVNPVFGLALILPGLVPHFFTGGAAGVYGNATGGRRGAVAGAFVNGVLITLLPAFLLGVLGDFGTANTTFGDADFGWFGMAIGYAFRAGDTGGVVIALLLAAVLLAGAMAVQKRAVKGGWDPGARHEKALAERAERTRAEQEAQKAREAGPSPDNGGEGSQPPRE